MIKAVKYHSGLKDAWDRFVKNSKNGTILHTRNFLEYHKDRFLDESVLLYTNSNDLIAVFPACNIDHCIISHGGSSYGGPVVAPNNTLDLSLDIFKALQEHFSNFRKIRFRTPEYIFCSYPSDEIEFAALHMGFTLKFSELSSAMNLQMPFNPGINRTDKIKRADKKLQYINEDLEIEKFYKMLAVNLDIKHQTSPTHTLEELTDLKKRFPSHMRLLSAYFENQMVAGIWMFELSPKRFHTFYLCQDYNYKHLYSLSGLIAFTVKQLRSEHGIWLNLGISTENEGKDLNEGLFRFKESFGFSGVERKTFEFEYK